LLGLADGSAPGDSVPVPDWLGVRGGVAVWLDVTLGVGVAVPEGDAPALMVAVGL
jgi:hypothetical protein